uniref:Sodium/potassium-transporting ATPase subunit beta n=1 Tax=Fundulus heteroclitus TaxID=8078 RepID=A0A3Q2T407_FUNHE
MSGNKDSDGGWRKFVWNSEKGEFLGRTGSSTAVIFILLMARVRGCVLAGASGSHLAALVLTVFICLTQTRRCLSGLSHTPRSEKSEISFKMSEAGTYEKYINTVKELLKLYDLENQNNLDHYEDCGDTPGPYKDRSDGQDPPGQKKSCRFQKTLLESCSGKDDDTFGFKQGNPCLIVKLNRIVNYRPRAPSNDTLPEGLKGKSFTNLIPIHCKNKREEDATKIGEIKYYGFSEGGVVGFPLQYYPYYGKQLHGKYLQPLVAIQFTNLTLGEELRIECKVYGDNIYYNEKDRYQGRFDVKFTVNS